MANKKYCWSWSDLPQELLELIMASLTTTFDLLRCRSVCHSWRYASLRVLSSCDINNGGGVPTKSSSSITPLLLLYSDEYVSKDYHSKLLCLGKNTTMEYRYRGPNTKRLCEEEEEAGDDNDSAVPKRTICIATNRGWLLLYTYFEMVLYLFNPLSRMVVQLPPLPKLAVMDDPKFIITSSIPTDPTCMVYLYSTISGENAIYTLGDKEWTHVFTTNYYRISLIFYQGKFYSLDKFGALLCLDKSHSSYEEGMVCNGTSTINLYRYLVESGSGELLMIVRTRRRRRRRTRFYEIFKFNWSNCKWEEVRNFSKHQALFLAHNDSKFVSVRYNPDYRPNSIYFIEESKSHNNFGVYNLTTRKVEPLNLSHHQQMQYPYSRWFQPVL